MRGVLIGAGAAARMDTWALFARRALGTQGLDYPLLGRRIGCFPRGQFFLARIAAADPVRGQQPIGWLAHHAIGIAFAFGLFAISSFPLPVDRGWRGPTDPGAGGSRFARTCRSGVRSTFGRAIGRLALGSAR